MATDRSSTADDTCAATLPPQGVSRSAGDVLVRGDTLGRYVISSRLGAGGMGIVYAAYDPDLDRKIALKLLLPGRGGTDARTRLLREAQALARLQHPNVVTLHDVGMHDERVWLAMELVEGQTVAKWRAEKPRSWHEVLDVFVRAGRGVAAAHAAGLLHRDLKPDNIMVGEDGRVRVMDFGLALPRGEASNMNQIIDSIAQGKHEALELHLTRPGALMGTPGYMAPEQFADAALGPATDQFSYCVALWEALYGSRPFSADDVMGLAVAILSDQRAPVPKRSKVPTWLRRILDRGLSIDPAARWPSMQSLLEALAKGHARSRLARASLGVGVIMLAVGGVLGAYNLAERRHMADCEATGTQMDDIWNEERRAALRTDFLATRAVHAATTVEKVMPWFDDQANEWRRVRVEACVNAVNGRWNTDLMDRAVWCLDERRLELDALVTELSQGGVEAVTRAVKAASQLRPVDVCRDESLLMRSPPPPADARDEVRAIHAELSRAAALQETGAYDEGLRVAHEALARAEPIEWPWLIAAARVRVGLLLGATGEYEQAEAMQESAYFEAMAAGATETALVAANGLVNTVGTHLARPADGERWARHAALLRAVLPDTENLREAEGLSVLAIVHGVAGAHEEAARLHQRALDIREKALGPMHPLVAASLHNLGYVQAIQGAYDQAAPLQERALAILETVLGSEHPSVATSLNNLANVRRATGALVEAATLHQRALAIRERVLGPEHPDVALSLHNLANVRTDEEMYDEAATLHERALAIREKALGPEHPDVASSLHNLGGLRAAIGEHDEARALYERALRIWEQALGPEHRLVAHPLASLASVALVQNRPTEALLLAERALKLLERHEVPAAHLARARFVLARALVEAGEPKARAVMLATQARDGHREAGEPKAVAEIESWLEEHAAEAPLRPGAHAERSYDSRPPQLAAP